MAFQVREPFSPERAIYKEQKQLAIFDMGRRAKARKIRNNSRSMKRLAENRARLAAESNAAIEAFREGLASGHKAQILAVSVC